MHITATETKKRLERADNLVVMIKNGHPFGTANHGPPVPPELRSLAKMLPGTNKKVAEMLDCRPDTVGKIRGAEADDVSLKDELQAVMTQARGSALDKLNAALEHITIDKLKDAKLRELSGVAKDMSGIAKDLIPETKDAGLKVIIYNTPERERDDYEIIEVTPTKDGVHEGGV